MGFSKIDQFQTGLSNVEEVIGQEYKMENVDSDKYLGDIISADGSNLENILARKQRDLGSLNDYSFGPCYLQVVVMFRSSMR